MSELKDKATKLKEISKKYGYELKHTHALEIVSQFEYNTNRHVTLDKQKREISNFGLNFDKAPLGIDNPFYQGYVIEIKEDSSELIDFYVTDKKELDIEIISEFSNTISSFRFMKENEVADCSHFSFRLEGQDNPVPYASLLEWINVRAKETQEKTFLVVSVTNYDVQDLSHEIKSNKSIGNSPFPVSKKFRVTKKGKQTSAKKKEEYGKI